MAVPNALAFPIHFVTSAEREAEVITALAHNEAPPERPTTVPADFVKLETEEARRHAEPFIAISGLGWQHLVENPNDIANLWSAAAYFGTPEPDIPLLMVARSRLHRPLGRRPNRRPQPVGPPGGRPRAWKPGAVAVW